MTDVLPTIIGEREPYAAYVRRLEAGDIAYQTCGDCGLAVFHPRVLCPHCGSDLLEWRASAGQGVVYSVTVVSERTGPGYAVCLVDLDEGFRMMSTVIGVPPADVRIGDRVRGRVEERPTAADEPPTFRVVFEQEEDSNAQ